MRKIDSILRDKRVVTIWKQIVDDKAIQLKLDVYCRKHLRNAFVKFTKALNWEHLSVSFEDETPNWNTMQELKEMFWEDDENAFQLHPTKKDYINNHQHCLHMWRPLDIEIPTPPTILVGFRDGFEDEDRIALKNMQEALGSPLSDMQINMMMLATKGKNEDIVKAISKMSILEMLKFIY